MLFFFFLINTQSRQTVKVLSKLPEIAYCKMRNLKILKLLRIIPIGWEKTKMNKSKSSNNKPRHYVLIKWNPILMSSY